MRKFSLPSMLTVFFFSCSAVSEDPQQIVDNALATAGGDHLTNVEIEFKFRDIEYGARYEEGTYEYVRIFKDSADLVHDILTNDGFTRQINGKATAVADTMSTKYSNSLNSVIYFALLPIGLNDAAVNKRYIGEKEIHGKAYHKIEVTFSEEGGGEDFQDVFIYWINKETNKVDYLAYEYQTEGGGMRFRSAYNERYVGNIRFVDYINYKPSSTEVSLENIDDAYINDELEEVSKIALDNIKVNDI